MKKRTLIITLAIALALILLLNSRAFSQTSIAYIYPVKNAKLDTTGQYHVTKVIKRGNYLLVKLDNVKGWFRVSKKHPTKKDADITVMVDWIIIKQD